MESDYWLLTTQEKIQSVRSNIKTLEYSKYNLELQIIAEQAIDVPSETTIMSYQMQIEDNIARQGALMQELNRLEGELENV
jgi:hypothetical protein